MFPEISTWIQEESSQQRSGDHQENISILGSSMTSWVAQHCLIIATSFYIFSICLNGTGAIFSGCSFLLVRCVIGYIKSREDPLHFLYRVPWRAYRVLWHAWVSFGEFQITITFVQQQRRERERERERGIKFLARVSTTSSMVCSFHCP